MSPESRERTKANERERESARKAAWARQAARERAERRTGQLWRARENCSAVRLQTAFRARIARRKAKEVEAARPGVRAAVREEERRRKLAEEARRRAAVELAERQRVERLAQERARADELLRAQERDRERRRKGMAIRAAIEVHRQQSPAGERRLSLTVGATGHVSVAVASEKDHPAVGGSSIRPPRGAHHGAHAPVASAPPCVSVLLLPLKDRDGQPTIQATLEVDLE